MSEKHTQAEVVLALDLSTSHKNMLVGEIPNEEELAAFYEGKLGETRRAQVISFLASDESSFRKWIRLVETGHTLGLKVDQEQKHAQNTTLLSLIIEPIKAFFNSKAYMSGAAFAAIAVVAVMMQLNQSVVSIDNLYEEYGAVKIDGAFHLPTRGFNLFSPPVEAEPIVLSQGYYLGLEILGETDSVADLHIYKQDLKDAQQKLSDQENQIYLQLGKWAAISHYQCAGEDMLFFDQAKLVLDGMNATSSAITTEYAHQLSEIFNALPKNNSKNQVCGYAKVLSEKVH